LEITVSEYVQSENRNDLSRRTPLFTQEGAPVANYATASGV